MTTRVGRPAPLTRDQHGRRRCTAAGHSRQARRACRSETAAAPVLTACVPNQINHKHATAGRDVHQAIGIATSGPDEYPGSPAAAALGVAAESHETAGRTSTAMDAAQATP
jgi:hypothetical protein